MDHPDSNCVSQIVLRDEIRPADRAAVQSIVERTGFFRPDEVAIAVELVDERLARGPASGYHFVLADVHDAVAGYACFGPIPCTTASYDLYWVAVDPKSQRQGIGRALMSAVELRVLAAAAGDDRMIYAKVPNQS
jgi:GNAT superfamily N-acetyltransferase